MLPDSGDVESVVLGLDGVAFGIRRGSLFIDMSTIAPGTARKVAQEMRARYRLVGSDRESGRPLRKGRRAAR